MGIDPPAEHYHDESAASIQSDRNAPHPFEIALIRKIESKTKSVRAAFLLLDVDGDGRISPDDLRTVLHNELGLDMTTDQEKYIFSGFSGNQQEVSGDSCNNSQIIGVTYGEFAKYFNYVSNATMTSSEAGSAAAVGFHIDSEKGDVDHELPIHETIEMKRLRLRHQLRQTLSAHSSRTHGGSGMKETSLYLAIDVHRSGKVTMQEFLDWLKSVGIEWNMEDLKLVVLGCIGTEGKKLEQHLFGTNDDGLEEGNEAGMTEHEFAEFVESLDKDSVGEETNCVGREPQDQKGILLVD